MQRYIEIRIPSINKVEVKSKGYNLKQLQSRTVAKAGQEQEQDRSKSRTGAKAMGHFWAWLS